MPSLPPEAPTDGGRLAGRYRLLDPLGAGGSSSVFRAWDEVTESFRAIKVLDGAIANNARVRQRLLQEAEVMSRLQHPNVVVVYEAGADEGRVFLVMELLTGGSLMERIQEDGPLPPRMASTVLAGVLSALQCAHDHGVVHRDVKPHNVLLDGKGTPKVTDFGIARWDDALMTRTGTVLGTLAFMPPEQKLSARKVDLRSDVYAAGATFYTMLTGRLPYDLYAAELDESIARELYKGIPEPLTDVIRRATAFRLEERFASASAMQAALAAAVWELPEDPPSPPLVSPFRLGRARSLASMGPTLLGVTESAETTDLAKAQSPAPAPTPTPAPAVNTLSQNPPLTMMVREGPSPLVGLLLVVLVGLGLLGGALWLREQQAEAQHTPEPAIAPLVVLPQVEAEVLDTGAERDEEGRPRPRSRKTEEPPEDPPEPPALDGKNSVDIGRWKVHRFAAPRGKEAEDVYATLPADHDVPGPEGQRIRPWLALRCAFGKAGLKPGVWISLQSGLQGLQADEIALRLDGLPQPTRLVQVRDSGELLLPKAMGSRLLDSTQLVVSLGEAGDVTFTLEHREEIEAEFARCR